MRGCGRVGLPSTNAVYNLPAPRADLHASQSDKPGARAASHTIARDAGYGYTSGRGLFAHLTIASATARADCCGPTPPATSSLPDSRAATSRNSVSVPMGCTVHAWTPLPRSSTRRASVRLIWAALVAAYAPPPGRARWPTIEETLTITPPPCRRMIGIAAWQPYTVPR